MHGIPPGELVERLAINGFPRRQGPIAAAARRFLAGRAGLDQSPDLALRVVDGGQNGVMAVDPVIPTRMGGF
jgi:hypothetical protein